MQDEQTKGKDGGLTDPGLKTSENLSQTSAADAVTSKVEKDKQYGGAEVIEIVNRALSADGREQKSRAEAAESALKAIRSENAGLKTQYTTLSGQVSQLLKAKDDEEADKVKDNPEALTSLRARQANRAEALRLQGVEAEATRKLQAAEAKAAEATQKETTLNIKLAAIAGGVDEKELADLVPDGNPERLTKAVNILKRGGQANTQQLDEQGRVKADKDGKEIPAALRTKPASAISAGGDSRSISQKMLEKAKAK